ncbi:5'-nucleotidase, lipoprotein e(P4) family [Kushneria indalinina]|uniref:5'-nucleotidase (Lipoprotein e(P4) family) n=1 Tax=Kushneria indalinina DSM 14324 TaxID=1122140 RepID=A0A3D9DTF1_9GAMM|nr:5'-nucleotidase, lipoprotein e(P4) family [Kushneria indalinina]REC94048.1 5'-nucleotidase (lipoprotein e(P4) family) [Kushneria indalinina DSM 14324]
MPLRNTSARASLYRRRLAPTLSALAIGVALSGCASQEPSTTATYSNADLNEQLVMATAWMQSAAEYRALSYQAFNVARLRLDQALEARSSGDRTLAVIVDCDEAVIDNTPFQAWLIGRDEQYSSASWNAWVEDAQARAMPGAGEFLNYAHARGVEVFYVTNRRESGLDATMENLRALDFPWVDEAHMMLRTESSDKQARRDRVMADHDVALLIGDHLADFDSRYDADDVATRNAQVIQDRAQFGERYIVLPNPTYGGWEAALYEGDFSLSPRQKDQRRRAALRTWSGPEHETP